MGKPVARGIAKSRQVPWLRRLQLRSVRSGIANSITMGPQVVVGLAIGVVHLAGLESNAMNGLRLWWIHAKALCAATEKTRKPALGANGYKMKARLVSIIGLGYMAQAIRAKSQKGGASMLILGAVAEVE